METAALFAGLNTVPEDMMDISDLLTSTTPEKAQWLQSKHPHAYFEFRKGMRSGIVRYEDYFLVDPDTHPSELGYGKTPEIAFHKAFLKENPEVLAQSYADLVGYDL